MSDFDQADPDVEGRRVGRELWPAGASWVPEEVLDAWREIAARHPVIDTDAARTAFLNAARSARKSAPTTAESRGRGELLARLAAANAARTAAAHEANDEAGAERDPEAAVIARRRRDSFERRRARHENG
ncbi:hypothetical protein [Gryllotalpicola protaetiae]|uniref:Uncharacterized protein n=1 Tax=Gryllotalpicola protaetiae TaxID=2419771 RepID=A0A387BL56_9MICO|nr:hypothetical protein [Gryllotalpicola protaetiae]AYG04905.1 hypothetical protein D7I44_16155 [Gryllotalpicola protaetiae]